MGKHASVYKTTLLKQIIRETYLLVELEVSEEEKAKIDADAQAVA